MSAAPTRTGSAAIAWARNQITSPSKGYFQLCLQFTRMCFGVGAKYADANKGWAGANRKHVTSNAANIPAGVPVWWAIGKWGHVAISTGNGKCVSNDIKRRGKVDEVEIDLITKRWGARLLGWSEDVNGVIVYKAPTPTPTPAQVTLRSADLRTARNTDPSKSGSPVGKYGAQVKVLQEALRKLGLLTRIPTPGHYGTATVKAVQAFQRKYSGAKAPDGWMGPKELARLKSLTGGKWNIG